MDSYVCSIRTNSESILIMSYTAMSVSATPLLSKISKSDEVGTF